MTTNRKKLVKKLDQLCRKILLIRDRYAGDMFRCVSCRRLYPIQTAQVGHYISRRYESLRWDTRNIALQCPACNKWKSGNTVEYRKALVEIYGEDEVVRMETFYRESPHYSVFDLEQLLKEKQEVLKAFISDNAVGVKR